MVLRILRKLLRSLGIVAFRRSSRVYLSGDDSYQIAAELVGCHNPVVFDGGAHRGDMPLRFGKLMPKATFHCFEPDPDLAEELRRAVAKKPSVKIVQSALGDSAGKKAFNINASRPTNSLLPSADNLQPDLARMCKKIATVEVDVTSVDEYCHQNSVERVDILKLDLQGYDYLALLGAKEMLKEVRVVIVEILFKEIYRGGHKYIDIFEFMQEANFGLYTLCGLQYGPESELCWADAIFINLTRSA